MLMSTHNILEQGKKYVMIQIALQSTRNPKTAEWLVLWKRAKFVWSYYDIPYLMEQENVSVDMNFLHTPLGVNTSTFYHKGGTVEDRMYISQTNGVVTNAECIYENFDAAAKVGRKVAHFGTGLEFRRNVDYYGRISDFELNNLYNRCIYVSGLRRKDGFELSAAEGIICGARPIMFDNHNYRQWFDGLAEFIPEQRYNGVVDSLVDLFQKPYQDVSPAEIIRAKALFNWETIVKKFWSMCVG
jgi:glycosyltransferase involved in cell wall biosynthesis